MKIIKHGTVTLTDGPVQVDGWLIEREPTDLADASNEELLLEVVIPWAKNRLAAAIYEGLKDASKRKKASLAHNLTEN